MAKKEGVNVTYEITTTKINSEIMNFQLQEDGIVAVVPASFHRMSCRRHSIFRSLWY